MSAVDYSLDDAKVVLRDTKAFHVDGHMETFGGSATFMRDPRIQQPTDAMLARGYWQADHEAQAGDLFCSRCGDMKPADAFGADRTRANGKCYVCRECRNTQRRRLYAQIRAIGARVSTKVSVLQETGVR